MTEIDDLKNKIAQLESALLEANTRADLVTSMLHAAGGGIPQVALPDRHDALYLHYSQPNFFEVVLCHKRGSDHEKQGVLVGQVVKSPSLFYDGCAVKDWGGKWFGPLTAAAEASTLTGMAPKPVVEYGGRRLTPENTVEMWGKDLVDGLLPGELLYRFPPKGGVLCARDAELREISNAARIVATDADGVIDGIRFLRGLAVRVLMQWGDQDGMHRAFVENVKAASSRLQVWFGPMPESNGKTNWTAILHRGDITEGFTIERSEYKDRVRYEADRVRYLLGELTEKPWIGDYDPNLQEKPQ